MPDDYLERRREDYNTNPMWKKVDYSPFPYPNILEKAGYRVENIEDFSKLQVYNAKTGEKLELSAVDHNFVDFKGPNNKFIRISTYGRVEFNLPNNKKCEATYSRRTKSINYTIDYDNKLTIDYVTLLNGNGLNDPLARIEYQANKDYVRVIQRINDIEVDDPVRQYSDRNQSARYTLSNNEVSEDYLLEVFYRYVDYLKKQEISNKDTDFTLEFLFYCLKEHIGAFLEYRYNDEIVQKIVESYENIREKIRLEYEEKINKLDETIEQIKTASRVDRTR